MKKLLRKIQKGSLLVLMLVLIVCAQPVPAKAAATDSMTIYAMYLDAQDKGDAVLIKSAGEYILQRFQRPFRPDARLSCQGG